jgi:hypothetical protein
MMTEATDILRGLPQSNVYCLVNRHISALLVIIVKSLPPFLSVLDWTERGVL